MIPVDQDIFVNDSGGRVGNCLQAAVASILELELTNVPHFCGVESDNWYADMVKWFTKNNYQFIDATTVFYYTGYLIACGKSERGFQHATVYCNGELVHDPHPSRAGLCENPNHYYIISKTL